MSYDEIKFRTAEQRKGIRFGVTFDKIKEAITSGKLDEKNIKYDKEGNIIGRVYITKGCRVSFNPTKQRIIQVAPYDTGKE